jgi:hypothetical protein
MKNFEFHFMCNSSRELEVLRRFGLNSFHCNQNAFVDETDFYVNDQMLKRYDAIYIAWISPFKRHHLAKEVSSLRLLGGNHSFEQDYAEAALNNLKHAHYSRHVPTHLLSDEIAKSKVGLCLSKIEGLCLSVLNIFYVEFQC